MKKAKKFSRYYVEVYEFEDSTKTVIIKGGKQDISISNESAETFIEQNKNFINSLKFKDASMIGKI